MEYTVALCNASEQGLGIDVKGLRVPPYCQSGCAAYGGDFVPEINGLDATGQNPDDVKQTNAPCPKDCAGIEPMLGRSDRRFRRSGLGVAPLYAHAIEEDIPLKPCPNPPTTDTVSNPIPMVSSSHSVSIGERPQHQRLTQPMPLQNLIMGTELSDRLHNQSTKVCNCSV